MRYFCELAYNGTEYSGWQRQPNAPTLQQTIEEALSMILRAPISIMGCGRTDTGVHAKQYFFHFDYQLDLPKGFSARLNKVLAKDIAIKRFFAVAETAHSRFDASHRAYEYHIVFDKNPFETNTSFHYPFARKLDLDMMQTAATLLLQYDAFFPFCKSNTDVKTMICDLRQAEWIVHSDRLVFHIAANRFLRGMVRLIVGMCLNVGIGKLSINTVKQAMEQQTRIDKSYSVPPQGLFLKDIRYDYVD